MSSSDHTQGSSPTTEPAVVLSRIHRESERRKRRELETALGKLGEADGLSERERAVVEEMADRIVARILEPPTEALADPASDVGPAELTALRRLFAPAIDRDGDE